MDSVDDRGNRGVAFFIMLLLIYSSVMFLVSSIAVQNSPGSFTVDGELVWIRVEDDYTVHTLDANAVLTVRDLYNGSLIFEQRLNGTLADHGAVPCDTWKYRPVNLDYVTPGGEKLEGVCLMVNGDYSQDGSLHLNVCLVEQFYNYTEAPDGSHINRDHMEIVLCEFVDFIYDELDGEMSLLESDQSENIFAITYPTEAGLFRAFSNNSIVNLDTGVYTHLDGGESYGLIPPYPSNNGTYWYTTKCSEPDSNNPQLNVQATILDVEGHHERSLTILSGSCGGNYGTFWWYPVIVDRCLLTSGGVWEIPPSRNWPTSCLAYNTYDYLERGNPSISLKASWFWNRISSPCYHEFDGVQYQYIERSLAYDLVTTKDNSGVPMPFDFIILDSINESRMWGSGRMVFEEYPGECSDIFSESVVVLYADGDKIRISSGNSDLLDDWPKRTISSSDTIFIVIASIGLSALSVISLEQRAIQKQQKREEEEVRKQQEEQEKRLQREAEAQRRLLKRALWTRKEEGLRTIAESVFPKIVSFEYNLYLDRLEIETNEQELHYDDVLKRNLPDIRKEMQKDYEDRGVSRTSYVSRYVSRYGRSSVDWSNQDDDINSVDGGPPSEASDDSDDDDG